MEKITYKQVNVLQYFPTDGEKATKHIYNLLKDANEDVLVSYQVNIDNPSDITFTVGAANPDTLKKFIYQHAATIAKLGSGAAAYIRKYYSGFHYSIDL